VVRRRAPAILGPALFTDQRHERDGAKILLLEISVALARKLDQSLMTLLPTHRNDQATADRKLLLQRRRHLGAARRDQDRVKGCGLGPPPRAVTDTQIDVVVTKMLEPLPRRGAERGMALNRVHLVSDLTHNGRRVAGACAYFEDAVARLDLGRLDHQRDDIRL
jgi:hypothetical protein